jgi:hypothetical protein
MLQAELLPASPAALHALLSPADACACGMLKPLHSAALAARAMPSRATHSSQPPRSIVFRSIMPPARRDLLLRSLE